jgi:6-phosphogluconolactonase
VAAAAATHLYVGTYTTTLPHVVGKAAGIYLFRFDPASGALAPVGLTPGVVNPSFLAFAPGQRFLYAVNETNETNGEPSGEVSAFAVDPASGNLTFLNRQLSMGTAPCHLVVDPTGACVVVANHNSGSVAVFPIRPDGSVAPASDVVQHHGSSVHPQAQQGPHAHSVNFDRSGRFLFVCDKGIDQVLVYRLDARAGRLHPNDPPFASVRPGSAPRHLAVHPSAPYVYEINEIASTITAFVLDEGTGALREVQTISTLPAGFTGRNSTADLRVHPNGRFLYGSNRGHDSVAIFAIDLASGALEPRGHVPTQGAVPRNVNLDPTGRRLLAANQNSDTIIAFAVDEASGALTPTGAVTSVPTPVCLLFARF